MPQGNISRRRHIAYGVYIANSQNLYRRVRSRWFLRCRKNARRVEDAAPYKGCRIYLWKQKQAANDRPYKVAVYIYGNRRKPSLGGRGTALAVDEGNLYHSFYGTRYQFYVVQICSISRVVEGADPYNFSAAV